MMSDLAHTLVRELNEHRTALASALAHGRAKEAASLRRKIVCCEQALRRARQAPRVHPSTPPLDAA